MPKYIENLRERIIVSARETLKENRALSMRELAVKCDVASGTIYNYFPNKETILASIIAEDFKQCLENIDMIIEGTCDFLSGSRGIYECFSSFVRTYDEVWKNYQDNLKYQKARNHYHSLLRETLNDKMRRLLTKLNLSYDETYLKLFGEVLIDCTLQSDLGMDNYLAYLKQIGG